MSEIPFSPHLNLPTRELSGEDAKRTLASNAPESPTALINSFLDWQLTSGLFRYAVFAAERGLFGSFRRGRNPFPAVCSSVSDAEKHRSLFVKRALRGFELIVANDNGPDVFGQFFTKFGYVASPAPLASNVGNSLMKAAWNASELSPALELAVKLGGKVFCCFAHDADPVYVVSVDGSAAIISSPLSPPAG